MALEQADIEFIKRHLGEWLTEQTLGKPAVVYEIELRERMIRVEEELKNQRDLILQIVHQMDMRFTQVDKRFERVDKRFEEQRSDMNHRFDQMDRRFEALTRRMDRFMIWSFGVTLAVGGTVIAAMRFML